jgi:hypothetical protein
VPFLRSPSEFRLHESRESESMRDAFKVFGKPRVVVKVDIPGSIVVRKGTQDGEVLVDSYLVEPESIEYYASQEGNNVTVRGRLKSSVWNPLNWGSYVLSGGPRANVEISVPAEADLRVENMTDPITISAISGEMEVESRTGSIRVRDSTGSYSLGTQTGSIELENVNGIVRAKSTTGQVRFSGSLAKGDSSFLTTTGSIDISLLGEPDLSLDASTTVGSISCTLPQMTDARNERGEFVGQRFNCKLGSASGRLVVKTTVGSIAIHG